MLLSKKDFVLFAQDNISKIQSGCPLLLSGPLGVGKSTLGRYFIEAFLEEKRDSLPSPSFPIMLSYEKNHISHKTYSTTHPTTTPENNPSTLWHMDLYRLNNEEDILTLDIPLYIEQFPSIIEWPERLGSLLPQRYLHVSLDFSPSDSLRLMNLKEVSC